MIKIITDNGDFGEEVAEKATLDMVKIVGLENSKKVRNVAKLLVNNVHKALAQLFVCLFVCLLSRLGTPGAGPLPSGCNEDNKSGTLRVVYIKYCMPAR